MLLYILQRHEYAAYHLPLQELAEQVSHIVIMSTCAYLHVCVYPCLCLCAFPLIFCPDIPCWLTGCKTPSYLLTFDLLP